MHVAESDAFPSICCHYCELSTTTFDEQWDWKVLDECPVSKVPAFSQPSPQILLFNQQSCPVAMQLVLSSRTELRMPGSGSVEQMWLFLWAYADSSVGSIAADVLLLHRGEHAGKMHQRDRSCIDSYWQKALCQA